MKTECTAFNCIPLVTGRNIHRLPPGCTHFKPSFPVILILCVLKPVGHVHTINRPSDTHCVHHTKWVHASKGTSILESVPKPELTVSHVVCIPPNPNEVDSPLEFSFVEVPKCSQSLQRHLPQKSDFKSFLKHLTFPNFI